MVKETRYEVIARKPYPNAKKRICDNLLLARKDGTGKHWIADFATPSHKAPE